MFENLKHPKFKEKLLFYATLVFFIVYSFFLYCNSISGGFELDDSHTIQNNPAIHDFSFEKIGNFFLDPHTSSALPENATLRPLTTLTFALCWKVGGGQTYPFHFIKILMHALCACLIFVIFLKLFENEKAEEAYAARWFFSFLGALFFLIHPANSETVIYLSATSTLQCTLFYLLGFYFCLRAEEEYASASSSVMFLFGLSFWISVFSKEEGITLPLVCFLYIWLLGKNLLYRKILDSIQYLGFAAIFALIYKALHPTTGTQSMVSVSQMEYLFTQFRAWAHYLLLSLVPYGLSIEHMNFGFSKSLVEARVLLSLLLHGTLIGGAFFYRKKYPIYSFCIFAFYLAILPASSVFVLAEPINEHRYYIAYAFLLPAVARAIWMTLHKLAAYIPGENRIKFVYGSLVFIILGFSILTVQRSQAWSDSVVLWEEAVRSDPTNGRAHNNAGILYMSKADFPKAIAHFDACIQHWPEYKYCYLNLYIANRALHKTAEAGAAIEKALKLDPESVMVLHYASKYYFEDQKDYKKATEILDRCDKVSEGKYLPCVSDRFGFEESLNHLEKQKEIIEEKLIPFGMAAKAEVFRFGLKMIEQKKYAWAESVFSQFHIQAPADIQTRYNLAYLDLLQKNWQRSKERWLEVLDQDSNIEAAWLNLNMVAEKLGDKVTMQKCKEEIFRIRLSEKNKKNRVN